MGASVVLAAGPYTAHAPLPHIQALCLPPLLGRQRGNLKKVMLDNSKMWEGSRHSRVVGYDPQHHEPGTNFQPAPRPSSLLLPGAARLPRFGGLQQTWEYKVGLPMPRAVKRTATAVTSTGAQQPSTRSRGRSGGLAVKPGQRGLLCRHLALWWAALAHGACGHANHVNSPVPFPICFKWEPWVKLLIVNLLLKLFAITSVGFWNGRWDGSGGLRSTF